MRDRPRLRTWFERSLDRAARSTSSGSRRRTPSDVRPALRLHGPRRRAPAPAVVPRGSARRRVGAAATTTSRATFRKATRVIVPNEAGRDQVVRYFRIEPERVCCLAHPTPDVRARGRAARAAAARAGRARSASSGRYLFYPAQFWAHKNHATLFDALAELARDGGEPYELVLVGSDKGQLDHVRALVARAPASRSRSTSSASSRPTSSSRSISTRTRSST